MRATALLGTVLIFGLVTADSVTAEVKLVIYKFSFVPVA